MTTFVKGSLKHSLSVRGKYLEYQVYDNDADDDNGPGAVLDSGTVEFKSKRAAEAEYERRCERLTVDGYVRESRVVGKARASKRRRLGKRPGWLDLVSDTDRRQLSKFEKQASRVGLQHRFDELVGLMRPGIDLLAVGGPKRRMLEAGSRIGGRPRLPRNVAWPASASGPFVFLAEFECGGDFSALDLEQRLPPGGILCFFAQLAWGAGDIDSDYGLAGRVFYFSDADSLEPREAPAPECLLHRCAAVKPQLRLTFAHPFSKEVAALGLSSAEAEAYHDNIFLTSQPPERRHHMLFGHPSHHVHYEGRESHLLQLASDERFGLEVGDFLPIRFLFAGKKLSSQRALSKVRTTTRSDVF